MNQQFGQEPVGLAYVCSKGLRLRQLSVRILLRQLTHVTGILVLLASHSARALHWGCQVLSMGTSVRATWTSSHHGGWVSRGSIPRDKGERVWYFWDLASEVTQSLLLYFVCPGSHKGQPKFKGIGHRFPLLMYARRAHGMGSIIAAIFGKHNLPSLLSGSNNSHPSQMQNTSLQDFPEVLTH